MRTCLQYWWPRPQHLHRIACFAAFDPKGVDTGTMESTDKSDRTGYVQASVGDAATPAASAGGSAAEPQAQQQHATGESAGAGAVAGRPAVSGSTVSGGPQAALPAQQHSGQQGAPQSDTVQQGGQASGSVQGQGPPQVAGVLAANSAGRPQEDRSGSGGGGASQASGMQLVRNLYDNSLAGCYKPGPVASAHGSPLASCHCQL